MLIIIKDGMLTEDKKESCYRYSGLFKVINRLCKLIETMEEVGEYITYYDKEFVRKKVVEEINEMIDIVDEKIEYAKVTAEKEKPFWQTGEITNVFNKYDYEEKKALKNMTPKERKQALRSKAIFDKAREQAFKKK